MKPNQPMYALLLLRCKLMRGALIFLAVAGSNIEVSVCVCVCVWVSAPNAGGNFKM